MTSHPKSALPKGVSCEVWIEHDAEGREIVLKQPLQKLKVAEDWRSNTNRFDVEARALKAVALLLGQSAVPRVVWIDAAQQRFAMERIDPRLRNWKLDLLAGHVDIRTATRVGDLLGLLQQRSSTSLDVARDFGDQTYFEELRIEPFFTRVAKRNPGLRASIEMAIATLREPGTTLVHGDFSPKNLLADGVDVVLLDWEIAHWGNPRFDVAFMLSHLILKGSRNVDFSPYLAAANAFLDGYEQHGISVLDLTLVRILGCLLLSRFEGASPVDYRGDLDVSSLKPKFATLILHPPSDVRAAVAGLLSDSR